MVLLRNLDHPALTADVLRFLASRSVLTVEDFLLNDTEALAFEAEKNLFATEFNKAAEALVSYLEGLHGGWSVGSELLKEDLQLLPINCRSLDTLLGGGFREGTVTELVGEPASGKTQICMQAAASVVHRFHSGVIYVDTCNSFSANRMASILESLPGFENEGGQQDVRHRLQGIQRVAVFNIFNLLSFLRTLHGLLQAKSETAGGDFRLRLLVIDSPSFLVSPVLGADDSRGHSLMMCVARCLNKLAVANKIAVVITNHTVNGDDGHLQPALGESWLSVPHVRLWLARDPGSDVCTAFLIKHTFLACHTQASYCIGAGGLVPVIDSKGLSQDSSSPSL